MLYVSLFGFFHLALNMRFIHISDWISRSFPFIAKFWCINKYSLSITYWWTNICVSSVWLLLIKWLWTFFHKFVVKIVSQPSVEGFNFSYTKSKCWVEREMYLYFYKQLPKLCSKVVVWFYILTSNIDTVPTAHFCNI